MSAEIKRVVEQLRRSFHGDAWHGPSVREALRDVDAAMAAARPIPGAHTIAELVAHLEFTQQIVLDRLQGRGRLVSDEESWPAVPAVLSEQLWHDLIARAAHGASALEKAAAGFSADDLDAPLVEGGSSAYNNLAGSAQHNAYHAAQIMLLKKAAIDKRLRRATT